MMACRPVAYMGESYFVEKKNPDLPCEPDNIIVTTVYNGEVYPVYFIEEAERKEFAQRCEEVFNGPRYFNQSHEGCC